jgi:succinate dehydrogenase / fumarate reductase, cytochrome b subunit
VLALFAQINYNLCYIFIDVIHGERMTQQPKKKFRNIGVAQIIGYYLPWAGKVSILHRISGLMLFLALPFILYLFELSITSELSFIKFQSFLQHPLCKLMILALIWGYLHHFCAGIRFLLLDMHKGIEKHQIQKSAVGVLCVSLILTAIIAAKLFDLF